MKAFLSKDGSQKLWMYRMNSDAPVPVDIKDAAKERYFYSKPENQIGQSLDDQITSYENSLSDKVLKIRSLEIDSQVPADLASEVVAHMTVRTAHVRGTFADAAHALLKKLSAITDSEESIASILGLDNPEPSKVISDAIKEPIRSQKLVELSGIPEATFVRVLYQIMREAVPAGQIPVAAQIQSTLKDLSSDIPSNMREAHQNSLSESMAPLKRVEILSKFNWSIRAAPNDGAILPDCVALGITKLGEWQPYIIVGNEDLASVVLPLTPERLLVGSRDQVEVNLTDYNLFAASSSYQFFLSPNHAQSIQKLVGKIGQYFTPLIATALEGVDQAVSDFKGGVPEALKDDVSTPPDLRDEGGVRALNFNVAFHDCASQEEANKVCDYLRTIIPEFQSSLPLNKIDGMTFATNYKQALIDIEKGYESSYIPEPTENEFGTSVSMVVTVKRNDDWYHHIIFQGWLAQFLISNDEEQHKQALEILWSQLSHVALNEIMEKAFPELWMKPLQASFDATLHLHTNGVFGKYFSAFHSAGFDPHALSAQADTLAKIINHTHQSIPAAKWSYHVDGDLEAFLEQATKLITNLMLHAATVAGYMNRYKDEPDYVTLKSALADAGLEHWFLVFQSDLRRIFNGLPRWTSYEEFYVFHRHFERLLAGYGVWLEDMAGGNIYAHIPVTLNQAPNI